MQKIYFGHAMNFFKKGMALSLLIFLGLIARAQSPSADDYEPNNTKETATPLLVAFAQQAATINISPANCHDVNDVDYYKIELPAGFSYLFSAEIYDKNNMYWNNINYTLDAQISYSTDGVAWSATADSRLPRVTVPAGTLYLKIEPHSIGTVGTYAAKIDLRRAASAGCTYTLPNPASRTVTAEAATNQQIAITATGATCSWTAFTNADWIRLTVESGTGYGNVIYSYTANTTPSARTGAITIAGHDYTVTQEALSPDGYEPNNTVAEAKLLPIPPFTQNASTIINISSVNCHVADDIDIYKIDLPAGNSYQVSAELYDSYSQRNRNYTLEAKMSYSTDHGVTWSSPTRWLPRMTVQGGTLYLKIEPFSSGNAGTYAAKIDISIAASAGCTYTLPRTSRTVTADGGANQQIAITAIATATGTACYWIATSNVNWIVIITASGTGSGDVIYFCTENTTPSARTGIITVAGQRYTVMQAPFQPDGYEPNNIVEAAKLLPIPPFTQNTSTINISSASCHIAGDVDFYKIELPAGASYTFSAELYHWYNQLNNSRYTLDAKMSCSTNGVTWSAAENSQLPMTAVQGGTFYLKIESYSGTAVGTYAAKIDLSMATTAGCTYTLTAPTSRTVTAEGATNQQITVTATGTACSWTATSNVDWITITTQSGTGSGNVSYSYDANTTPSARTGTITIAGQTLTVKQAVAPTCSFTLPSTPMVVSPAAGTGKVSVTASAADCPWTATSNVPWITILAGQTLAGTKDLDFSYEANSTNAPREGTITIAGQTFTVKQSQVTTGFETVSPVKIFPNPAKDFVTIEVSSSNQEWVSLKITNIFGQAFYEWANPEHKMQIPLTGFSSGLYFVVLQGKEKTAVQKLIIE